MSKKKKVNQKFKPLANPEFNAAMHALGSSNATSKHDSRPNRQRTRSNVKKNAIQDSRS